MNSTPILPVLYADDDENDIFLMERAFDKLNLPNPLKAVQDGKTAIAYLSGTGPYANREKNPLPCLMLLDLSMPGKSGHDIIQWIRSQPHVASLPIIVISSSNQETDIHRAYLLGANGYMIKPGDPDTLLRLVSAIHKNFLSGEPLQSGFVDVAGFMQNPENLKNVS